MLKGHAEENADNIDIPDIEGEVNLHLNAIMQQLPASDARLIEIRTETEKDETLKGLSRVINEGWPDKRKQSDDRIKMYWDYRTDLSLFDGLILKGCQIVIPPTLRREILDRIHTGHQGIVKCKRRARGSCFWPNMNKQIEQIVASCGECQRLQASKETPPLLPHDVPEKPWQKVGTDLF